jgi:hypothetical protein
MNLIQIVPPCYHQKQKDRMPAALFLNLRRNLIYVRGAPDPVTLLQRPFIFFKKPQKGLRIQ